MKTRWFASALVGGGMILGYLLFLLLEGSGLSGGKEDGGVNTGKVFQQAVIPAHLPVQGSESFSTQSYNTDKSTNNPFVDKTIVVSP